MSGIFGIFQRDGAFVDQIHMRSMLEGMRSWDVHGANTWRSGCIGLGHLLLQNTPESQYEHQPFVDEITGLAITSTSRLDNRDELLSSLGIPTDQHAILPDSALILEAYKKWGRACASHLLGDWCFAIWDEKEHNLFIARDTNGISGLYYYSTPQFFAFASSLVGLLALPQVPRILDENLLARTLAHLPLNSEHEVPTLYQGILHLGAAHAINVSVIAENLTEYWRIQDTPALLYRTDAEYLEAFQDVFQRAVDVRLRSPNGAALALSSGLDSLAVAAFASRTREITAYTAIPAHEKIPPNGFGRNNNEWELAHQAVNEIDNIHHVPLTSQHISPVQAVHTMLGIYHQPINNVGNLYWLIDILEKTQQAGLGTLLTGQRGNSSISWTGIQQFDLWPFILSGKWKNGWNKMQAWRTEHRFSWMTTIKRALLRSFVKSVQSRLLLSIPNSTPWTRFSAINPEFAREQRLWPQMQAEKFYPALGRETNPGNQQLMVYQVGRRFGGAIWAELAAAHRLEVSDPTADQRVLEFCFGIPDEQYVRAGKDRLLIRRALAETYPQSIVWNKKRGLQAADISLRVIAHASDMEALLDSLVISPNARRMLDLPKMRKDWESLKSNPFQTSSYQKGTQLLRVGMVGLFLKSFDS